MHRVLAVRGSAALAAIFCLLFLPGCGGSNSSNTKVTTVTITPTSVSLNEGAVSQLSVTAQNSAGTTVAADISFTSSNTAIATVSSGGLICGGVWDANIINCNATQGTAGVGQVTITATATAYNVSATVTVYVHEPIDQVEAVLSGSCTTMGQPIGISGAAFSTSAPGCSPSAPCNITSTVGPFTFGSNNTTVAASSSGIVSTFSSTTDTPSYTSGGSISGSKGQTCNLSSFNGVTGASATVALTGTNTIAAGTALTITSPGYGATIAPTSATLSNGTATCSGTATVATTITSGVMTAQAPGSTSVFASVSGVNSVGTAYTTCPVTYILVHDASSQNTTFTLNPAGTQSLTADVYDSTGTYIQPVLTWGSSSTATATVATGTSGNNPATVTAVAGGTAYITASCSYPTCNVNLPSQYALNLDTVNVTATPSTTVYAAGSNSKLLVPISTATNTAGTAITLPNYPNSIVADPAGKGIYLGSATGLMSVAAGATAGTTYGVNGTILAISPDGNYLLISDDVNNNLQYFSTSSGKVVFQQGGLTALSSAYTPDSHFNEWINATVLQTQVGALGAGLQTGNPATTPLSYTPVSLDILAQGGLTFVSSTAAREINVYSTCNQSPNQVLTANSPTLIKAIPNGTGAVAADSPAIDVISTPMPLNANCPVITQSSINSYDLGAGSYTAQQLLMSPDSSRAWIVSNLPDILVFYIPGLTPTNVPLAGGATAFNGGLTIDGAHLWVGTSDNTVHRIDTSSLSDAAQVAVNLTDANGNVTAPNLVCVLP